MPKKARTKKKAKKARPAKHAARSRVKKVKKATKRKPVRRAKKVVKKTKMPNKARPAKRAARSRVKKAKAKTAKKVTAAKKKMVKKITEKVIGKVIHYYDRIGVAVIAVQSPIRLGDTIRLRHGKHEFMQTVHSLQKNHTPIASAAKGQEVGMKVSEVASEGTLILPV
ncbi:MAG: hypothetical protein ABIG34_02405 [Candidatus Peregrinibacteria bacterium]